MSNVCEATPIKSLFWDPNGLTGNVFWISLQPDWQINNGFLNRPIMVWDYLISWYTGRGPEQQFWSCFTDRMLEVWFCLCMRRWWIQTAMWKLNQGQMRKQGERGWRKECSLSAFCDFFLSPPSQSFSHSTPYFTKTGTKKHIDKH